MDGTRRSSAIVVAMAVLQLATLGILVDVVADFRAFKAASHSGREFTVSATTHLGELKLAPARSPERRRLSSAIHSVSTITAAETLTSTSSTVIFCDTTGAAITVTLPTASDMSENSGLSMRRFIVINIGAAGNDCTVSTTASIYATGLTITNTATSTGTITNTVTASGTFTDASTTTTVYGGASATATTTDTATDAVTTVDGTIDVTTDVTSSITITPSVSSTIANDASSTATTSLALTDGSSASLITDGTNWYKIGGSTIAVA